mgnify:CR=1 FL=1
MKMSKKSKIVIYILLGLVAIYFLAPFIYMLFSAFKTEGEAIAYPPKLLPAEWHFENFINAWKSQPFGTYLWNSILVTVLTTVGQVLSCSLVAYGFARFNFKGKNILFMILLSTMMIPWDVTMIPQNWVELTDEESIKKMQRILDLLDEDDDVQATYHNWDE